MNNPIKVSIFMLCVLTVLTFVSNESRAAPTEASDTLPRISGSMLFGPETVWSINSTINYMFHPLSGPIVAKDVIFAMVDTLMDQDTGNCKIRPALRYSSDGVSWEASDDIVSSFRTAPGIDFGSSYIDLTSLGATPRAFVQFGVQVANESGVATEYCHATIRVLVKGV